LPFNVCMMLTEASAATLGLRCSPLTRRLQCMSYVFGPF
jgi:hypothetical protein